MREIRLITRAGHQALLMQKKILHRDVSLGNILRKPNHHGAEIDFEARPNTVPYIPINAIVRKDVIRSIRDHGKLYVLFRLSMLLSILITYRPVGFEGCGSPDTYPPECGVMADLDVAIDVEDSSDCTANGRTVRFAFL